ncbi:MAG: MlaD family protein [Bacteroidales bacterium]|jgi:phospholipid/cholesterol/gamma-HCH transport system substrate-binding protein|nr:MlaD family protein [Bacteroidales bacterium]
MKKITNEVKVGVTAFLTIVVFILLYNFLKGKDVFRSTSFYYTVYDKVGGLAESSPVEVNGYKVGVVQSISFLDAETGRLLVVFSVDKNFRLPVNTVAEIVPVSVLGGMKVQFVYGQGPGFYTQGDTIPGRLAVSILDKLETELMPVKDRLTDLINETDSVLKSINGIMDENFRKNLSNTMASLNGTAGSIDEILSDQKKDIKQTLESISKFSAMLSQNTPRMEKTFGNLEAISDTLASADIYGAVAGLKSSLEQTSRMLGNLNDGKGSAGQFLTNDSLYLNLSNSLQSLNLLLQDMKENPKKYVHFSLF